jgi:hypothetical protein
MLKSWQAREGLVWHSLHTKDEGHEGLTLCGRKARGGRTTLTSQVPMTAKRCRNCERAAFRMESAR